MVIMMMMIMMTMIRKMLQLSRMLAVAWLLKSKAKVFNMTALGGRAFGRKLGHENGDLMNGISVLIKGTQRALLAMGESHVRIERQDGSLQPRRQPSSELNLNGPDL